MFNEGLTKIGIRAFSNCSSLECISLPSTVTEIAKRAFSVCKSLNNVVLNEGLQKIGRNAFYRCYLLQSITIPSTITEIESHAFAQCRNMEEVVLNDGLQKIGEEDAFGVCIALKSITLPSTLTDIGNGAFHHCNTLREVAMNGIVEKMHIYGSLTSLYDCCLFERLTFPTISTRLEKLIQSGHYPRTEAKIDEVRGAHTRDMIEQRGSDLFIYATTMSRSRGWQSRKDLNIFIAGLGTTK